MVNNAAYPAGSGGSKFSRRAMFSLPVMAGGIFLFNEPIAAANTITPDIIKANTSAAESLVVYTNLLAEIRRSELTRALDEVGNDKAVISGQLREIVNLAKSLDQKYQDSSRPGTEAVSDIRRLTGQMSQLNTLADSLDQTREKLPLIAAFERKVDSIHSLLLDASADFAKAKDADTKFQLRSNLLSSGSEKLNSAISDLKKLLPKELNETRLESPLERFIVLLLGVQAAVALESRTSMHHTSFTGIMDVLRENIKPGSWMQLGVGYAVAFPVLIRNKEQNIREKLLLDGLRLVPGLVPSPLLDTAKRLAELTL